MRTEGGGAGTAVRPVPSFFEYRVADIDSDSKRFRIMETAAAGRLAGGNDCRQCTKTKPRAA